jgi:hypothetical protein
MVRKYVKKPVEIEAIQWKGDYESVEEVKNFVGEDAVFNTEYAQNNAVPPQMKLAIHTLEGEMQANYDDYIIKGVNGEFYPCKPNIFEKTYELCHD